MPQPQIQRNLRGFCADHLMRNAERLPPSVLVPERTRNGFLHLQPRPATAPAPQRQLAATGGNLRPWKQWLNQPLVFSGCAIKTHEAVARPEAACK